jgi:hypothetical protein
MTMLAMTVQTRNARNPKKPAGVIAVDADHECQPAEPRREHPAANARDPRGDHQRPTPGREWQEEVAVEGVETLRGIRRQVIGCVAEREREAGEGQHPEREHYPSCECDRG